MFKVSDVDYSKNQRNNIIGNEHNNLFYCDMKDELLVLAKSGAS